MALLAKTALMGAFFTIMILMDTMTLMTIIHEMASLSMSFAILDISRSCCCHYGHHGRNGHNRCNGQIGCYGRMV